MIKVLRKTKIALIRLITNKSYFIYFNQVCETTNGLLS